MANRAYLYSADRLDDWELPETSYYDSRHVIPLSWFFFYQPSDIRMVNTTFDGSIWWKEVKLAAEKDIACERFVTRRPLLMALNSGRLDSQVFDAFLKTVQRRSGPYLLMDPGEVVHHSDEAVGLEFASFLERIESGDEDAQAVLVESRSYIGGFAEHREQSLLDVVGYTYGSDVVWPE